MPIYFDLDRRFVHRTKYEPHEISVSGVTGKRLKWPQVLENRFVVVVAPANHGKTTEMVKQVERMRRAEQYAVYIALRKVADRSNFENALKPTEKSAYAAWRCAPTSPLTLFVDSLDEASAFHRDGIADLIADVAAGVDWPNSRIRWVISTRPAVLSETVLETISSKLVAPYNTIIAASSENIGSASTGSSEATYSRAESSAQSDVLLLYSMVPLEYDQAKAYLSGRHAELDAPEVLRIASEYGLAGFTSSPGGLDVLAHMGLTVSQPESRTEVFQRVVAAVQDRQRADPRVAAAGGATPNALADAARKIASGSQVCQLPNIELTDEVLVVTKGVLSVRKIAGDMLPYRILEQLVNTEMFIDVDLNQVKIYPDEISPFLGAQRLAGLIQSPQQAHKLVEHFTWQSPTGEQGVYWQFLPLLGWLATLNHHCREELLEREPQALAFFGDLRNSQVPLAAASTALTESIRRLVDQGDRLGRAKLDLTSANFWQAGPPRLAPVLMELFQRYGSHHWARDALLNIAAASRSDVLRIAVLKDHCNTYTRLIQKDDDLRYVLELGQPHDMAGIARAIIADDKVGEHVVATSMTRLSWTYLSAKDLAALVDKQFGKGRGGFSLSYAFDGGLVAKASDKQLYELCRALVVRLARLREREGRPARARGRTVDRYIELASETLAALLRRHSFPWHKRVALLCLVMRRIFTNGYFGTIASTELRQAISDNAAVRFELLSANIRWAGNDKQKLWTVADGSESFGALVPSDVEKLNSPDLTAIVRQQEANMAALRATPRPTRPPARDERLKLSQEIKQELLEKRDALRDSTSIIGLSWVAAWLLQTNPNSRYGEVRFEIFEKEAGPEIAQAVREGFSKVWRSGVSAFREDEPTTTRHITVAGLQGLHLELGDGKRLPRLTEEEVCRAIQYAVFEINSYPKWFWPVVEANQDVAGQELMRLIKQAKAGALSLKHAHEVLTSLGNAPVGVQAILAPLAWAFVVERPSLNDHIVERLLSVATGVPEVVPRSEFARVARSKMRTSFNGPISEKAENAQIARMRRKQSIVWAANWLSAYPTGFCKAVESWFNSAPDDARAFIFELAVYLGIDYGARLFRLAKAGNEGVAALARLYEWTVAAVRPEEDAVHPEDEAYSLDERDHAEQLRSALIPAIAAGKSQLAYDVLDKLRKSADGPMEVHLRGVQFEMREVQFARPPLAQSGYNDFERNFTAEVTDSTSFAMRIHSDLLAVKYDIERGEYSLRRFFTDVVLKRRSVNSAEGNKEGLALEADFQCLLASELHHHSNGLYTVAVEAHTAESKRRDVLCSKGDMFASIELKMSRRWT